MMALSAGGCKRVVVNDPTCNGFGTHHLHTSMLLAKRLHSSAAIRRILAKPCAGVTGRRNAPETEWAFKQRMKEGRTKFRMHFGKAASDDSRASMRHCARQ